MPTDTATRPARAWAWWKAHTAPPPWAVRSVATTPEDAPGLRAWHVEVFRVGHPEQPARRSAGVSYRRRDADAVAALALARLADPRSDPATSLDLFDPAPATTGDPS